MSDDTVILVKVRSTLLSSVKYHLIQRRIDLETAYDRDGEYFLYEDLKDIEDVLDQIDEALFNDE